MRSLKFSKERGGPCLKRGLAKGKQNVRQVPFSPGIEVRYEKELYLQIRTRISTTLLVARLGMTAGMEVK